MSYLPRAVLGVNKIIALRAMGVIGLIGLMGPMGLMGIMGLMGLIGLLAYCLSFEVGGVVEDAVEDLAVLIGEGYAPACHHSLCDGEEFLHGDIDEASVGTSFLETGKEDPWETCAIDVYSYSNYCGCV